MLHIFFLMLTILGWTQAHGHFGGSQPFRRPPFFSDFTQRPQQLYYKLCTYSQQSYDKCLYTVSEAKKNSIPLLLECTQEESRDSCIQSVHSHASDMVILTGHGYHLARQHSLEPVVFARESTDSLYIAVAPKNLRLIDLKAALLDVDEAIHRAFHAAIFFNLRRGHPICNMINAADNSGPSIRIVDSAQYTPTDDEILICPDLSYAEYADYERCNIEAHLQRAVFVKRDVRRKQRSFSRARDIKRLFDIILKSFGPNAAKIIEEAEETAQNFNFFSTFDGSDNLIFRNDTIAFDLRPTYGNGIDEHLFNYLHCDSKDQDDHDYDQLEL